MNSETNEIHQSKKYNKLLRTVALLVASKIKLSNDENINTLYSSAINPISAWLLITNFNTQYEITYNDDSLKPKLDPTNRKSFFATFNTYIKNISITIDIKTNLNKAEQLFKDLVSTLPEKLPKSIICPEVIIP